VSSPVARQAYNLKVVGSNPTPATNPNARDANTLAGFFVRQIAQIAPKSVDPRSAIKINAFLRRIIV
jgi:hypothetical protein